MLTVSTLRSLLGAGLGLEANVAGYIDALQARRLLPADGVSLNARAVAIVALALVCGEEPAKAPSAVLRLAEFRLSGVTQRQDTPGGAATEHSLDAATARAAVIPSADADG